MQLDFLTLYVIILLNSLTLAVFWGAIGATYRNFLAARYWLASNLLTTLGGGVLALEGNSYSTSVTIPGNLLIIAGFAQIWLGIRVFYDRQPSWGLFGGLLALSFGAMILVDPSRPSQNVIYAAAEFASLGLALATLLPHVWLSLGAIVAACAILTAMIGFGSEAASNLMRLSGALSSERYYGVAPYFLVATLFGGSLWNFGFLLMAFDRLRSELVELASTDELTGLPNRRGLMQLAPQLLAESRRKGTSISVLMIDVDKLKAINDRHGHAAGDACLIRFATSGSQVLPAECFLARLGGDEFCAILADTEMTKAEAIARDLSGAFAGKPYHWRGNRIALSVTVGIASAASSQIDLMLMMEEADAALYAARQASRKKPVLAAAETY